MHSAAVILDTCVWLAFLLNTEGPGRPVTLLLRKLRCTGRPVAMTASMRKDVFYIASRETRRQWRSDFPGRAMDAHQSQLIRDMAWTMLEEMDEFAIIVPEGMREDFFARHLRADHDDYEDDLLVGTAQAIGAEMVVTSDEALLRRFPELCATPEAALERLGGQPDAR